MKTGSEIKNSMGESWIYALRHTLFTNVLGFTPKNSEQQITGLTQFLLLVIVLLYHKIMQIANGSFAQSSCTSGLCICAVSTEDCLKVGADQRLDEEKLREEGEREIKAYELDPVGKEHQNVEALVIRIIEERCQEAHSLFRIQRVSVLYTLSFL